MFSKNTRKMLQLNLYVGVESVSLVQKQMTIKVSEHLATIANLSKPYRNEAGRFGEKEGKKQNINHFSKIKIKQFY